MGTILRRIPPLFLLENCPGHQNDQDDYIQFVLFWRIHFLMIIIEKSTCLNPLAESILQKCNRSCGLSSDYNEISEFTAELILQNLHAQSHF